MKDEISEDEIHALIEARINGMKVPKYIRRAIHLILCDIDGPEIATRIIVEGITPENLPDLRAYLKGAIKTNREYLQHHLKTVRIIKNDQKTLERFAEWANRKTLPGTSPKPPNAGTN